MACPRWTIKDIWYFGFLAIWGYGKVAPAEKTAYSLRMERLLCLLDDIL
jgi:hypothetical protein